MSYNCHLLWGDTTALSCLLLLVLSCVVLFHQAALEDPATSSSKQARRSVTIALQKYAAVDESGVLNVHVVPHTHDDVGWRKTVEQYFYGYNTSIDIRGYVKDILTSSMESLLLHDYRTFTYVESKYFSMWWNEIASDQQKDSLRYLMKDDDNKQQQQQQQQQQQWTFVNGAWSMHDEACSHFMGMIDSTTTGHAFLQRHLNGYSPKVAWQLDPFGHSATQASLLTHKLGMNAIYFGRIDYQDLAKRRATQECEGLWNPNQNQNQENNNNNQKTKQEDHDDTEVVVDPTVFWGLTGSYRGAYQAPPGFCYDVVCTGDTQLLELNETARYEQAELFLRIVSQQVAETKGPDILLTFGDDFMYSHAEQYFANLDLLIETVLLGQEWKVFNLTELFPNQTISRVNVFYSSPEYYTARKYNQTIQAEAAHAAAAEAARADKNANHEHTTTEPEATRITTEKTTTITKEEEEEEEGSDGKHRSSSSSSSLWSIKTDDFFPYSDCPNCFWTGYFTSRTAFKRFERVASGFLQAARQLDLLANNNNNQNKNNNNSTTTTVRMSAETHALYSLEDALGVSQHHDSITGTAKQHVADDYSKRLHAGLVQAATHTATIIQQQVKASFAFHYCPQLNESICETSTSVPFDTENNDNNKQFLYVVVYNPLARSRIGWPIRIPVSVPGSYTVEPMQSSTTSLTTTTTTTRKKQVSRAQLVQPVSTASGDGVRLQQQQQNPVYEIDFMAGPLPPLGGITYRISRRPPPQQQQKQQDDEDEARRLSPREEEEEEETTSDLVVFEETTVKASNGLGMTVSFDRATGQIQHVMSSKKVPGDDDKDTVVEVDMKEQWGYYIPLDQELDTESQGENSGAYIFRPSNQTLQPLDLSSSYDSSEEPRQPPSAPRFLATDRGLDVHTFYGKGSWIQQIVRIRKDLPWMEVEFTVGPIPVVNGRGMEVVSRYIFKDIHNQGIFYTDSNARAFQKRQRDLRPSWNLQVYEPVAGNYYPVNAALYTQDNGASAVLLTDRSRGGSSIVDGTIEVKVQRRTLADDHRGVDEPLNETVGGMTPYPPYGDATRIGEGVTIRGTHRILVGGAKGGATLARSAMDEVFAQPLIFLGSPCCSNSNNNSKQPDTLTRPTFSVLDAASSELPPNVFLMTFMRLYDEEEEAPSTLLNNNSSFSSSMALLLRLAHQYGPGEDPILSQPAQVNLELLLQPMYKVVSVVEKTLSGNQNWDDFVQSKYNWTSPLATTTTTTATSGTSKEKHAAASAHNSEDDKTAITTTVTIQPLDIRTFRVVVEAVVEEPQSSSSS